MPGLTRRLGALLLLIGACGAAPAQDFAPPTIAAGARIVSSPAPDKVAVTVYRNPSRGRYDPMNLAYLRGFALVTERRRIRLPAGPAMIRFEGVAEGIVPVSAIIDGLPGGTIEKNRDARLLSPAALIDGTLGNRVTLTRTDRATGQHRSEEATIVAGPAQGVVLKTSAGIETLRCSGLPESLRFGGMPAGLSAKPVLSVATTTPSARTVTVTLSYLAAGFDWSASYVATVAPDGGTLDLFAWLTLANGNPERFISADVKAVAGRLNRTATDDWIDRAASLRLACYPLGTTTSDLPTRSFEVAEDIVVTASRVMAPMMMLPAPPPPPAPAQMPPPPEDLGDLKLYSVPRAVTVAPRAQKQVALLAANGVPFERRYRRSIDTGRSLAAAPTAVVLVVRNRRQDRLGMPLPAGTTALYGSRAGERLLLGIGTIDDHAIDQTVRIGAGSSSQVRVDQRAEVDRSATLTVTNANPFAVEVELPIGSAGDAITALDGTLTAVDGVATWRATIPPNDTATLRYRYG